MGTPIPNSQGDFPRGAQKANVCRNYNRTGITFPIMNFLFLLLTGKQDKGAIRFLANNSLLLKAHGTKTKLNKTLTLSFINKNNTKNPDA